MSPARIGRLPIFTPPARPPRSRRWISSATMSRAQSRPSSLLVTLPFSCAPWKPMRSGDSSFFPSSTIGARSRLAGVTTS
jgi:hypothetical protein